MLKNDDDLHWYVLRDLKRANAKLPAYKQLQELGLEVFTPMRWCLKNMHGKQMRTEVPYIRDLLFVHAKRLRLDAVIESIPTLQYRFQKGRTYREPMMVRDGDMERFIRAVTETDSSRFYLPDELTPSMYGRKVRIVGGSLDGYEGFLLRMRGSHVKRLLVELPTLLVAAVEVSPEYIQLL